MDRVMWHLTKACHVSSIMANGLLINQRNGLTVGGHCKWVERRMGFVPVFLTSDVDRLVREQLTQLFVRQYDVQVIQIDVTDCELIDERRLYDHGAFIDFSQPAWTFVSPKSFEVQKLRHVGGLEPYVRAH